MYDHSEAALCQRGSRFAPRLTRRRLKRRNLLRAQRALLVAEAVQNSLRCAGSRVSSSGTVQSLEVNVASRWGLKGLDLALLIDAEHHGPLRWVRVQADDVPNLGLQLRVSGGGEGLALTGLHAVPAPRPRHRRVNDLELRREQPRRPMRHPQPRRRRIQRRSNNHREVDGLGPTRASM